MVVTDRVELSRQARDFLLASIRRDRRRRGRSTAILSTLLVLAVLAAGAAFVQQRAAEERQRLATARLLLTRAETIVASDPRTALRLAEAANNIHPGRGNSGRPCLPSAQYSLLVNRPGSKERLLI